MNVGQVENIKQTDILHTYTPSPVAGENAATEAEISFTIVLVFNTRSYCFAEAPPYTLKLLS